MPSECRPRNAIVVEPDERERKLYGDHPWRTNIGHRNTGNPEVGQRPLDHDVTIQQCRQATHRTTAWSVLRSAIWNGETSDAGSRAALGRVRPRVHYCSQARPGTYGSCERTTAERCDEMYLVDHDRLGIPVFWCRANFVRRYEKSPATPRGPNFLSGSTTVC
jgi:hypothetical protein